MRDERRQPGAGRCRGLAAGIVVALAGTATALAQSADSVTVDVAECVGLESAEERFACYERRVEAARSGADRPVDAPDAPAAPAAPRAEPAAAPERPRNEPDAPPAPRTERVRRRDAEDRARGSQEVTGTVAAVRETVPNNYVITLENGEVWRQTRPKWYPLQPGYRVRIYPTRWGNSYRLSAEPLNGFIQVERVR